MFRSVPLKLQLIALLLIAALPVVGALGWQNYQEHRMQEAAARQTGLSIAKVMVARYAQFLDDVRAALQAAATHPDAGSPQRCTGLLDDTRRLVPQFEAIAIVTPDARVRCASPRMPYGMTLANTPWFSRARTVPGYVVSDPMRGPATGTPVVAVSLPAPARAGGGWIVAGLELERLRQLTEGLALPSGAVVSVLTRDGRVISRQPPLAGALGQPYPNAGIVTRAAGQQEGTTRAAGLDRVDRVYGYARVPTTGWLVNVGLPESAVFDPAEQSLLRAVALGGLGLLMLGLLAGTLYRSAVHANRILVQTARALRNLDGGETLTPAGSAELRAAIESLNGILHERRQLEARVRDHEAMLDAIIATAADIIVVTDEVGRIELFNAAAERTFLWSADDVIGQPFTRLLSPDERRPALELFSGWAARGIHAAAQADGLRPLTGLRSNGTRFPLELAVGRFEQNGAQRFTAVARDVTARHATERELQDALARMRHLSRQLVDVQERERRSIAHELHDQIGQALTAAQMRLRLLLRRRGIDLGDEDAKRLSDILDVALASVRSLSRSLRPEQLDHLGLVAALQDLVREMCESSDIQCRVDVDALGDQPEAVSLVLYRIAQEALTNVVRHADARHVELTGHQEDGHVVLRIADDGGGIAASRRQRPGIGLQGIQERAAILGGKVDIHSAAGTGTAVVVRLPIL